MPPSPHHEVVDGPGTPMMEQRHRVELPYHPRLGAGKMAPCRKAPGEPIRGIDQRSCPFLWTWRPTSTGLAFTRANLNVSRNLTAFAIKW